MLQTRAPLVTIPATFIIALPCSVGEARGAGGRQRPHQVQVDESLITVKAVPAINSIGSRHIANREHQRSSMTPLTYLICAILGSLLAAAFFR